MWSTALAVTDGVPGRRRPRSCHPSLDTPTDSPLSWPTALRDLAPCEHARLATMRAPDAAWEATVPALSAEATFNILCAKADLAPLSGQARSASRPVDSR